MSRRKTSEGRRACSSWKGCRLGFTVLLLLAVFTQFLSMSAYFTLFPLDNDAHAHWINDQLCIHSNPSPLMDRKEASTKVVPFSDFLEGPGLVEDPNTTEAICEFRPSRMFDLHFPHTMQHLYRCVSWWRAHPNKTSILLNPPEKYSAFTDGMLHMLQDLLDVKFVHKGWPLLLKTYLLPVGKPHKNAVSMNRVGEKERRYEMRSPSDFEFIREKLAASVEGQSNHAGCPSHGISLPKVTILNRELKDGRHILNVERLKHMIDDKLGLAVNVIPSLDGRNFLQQIQVMQDTDILLSPHGAQLTSIPFIPSCGHVMEFFSVEFKYIFFGSLATTTGHSYSHFDMGYNSSLKNRTRSLYERHKARSKQICIPEEAIRNQIIPALTREVSEWQRCCNLLQGGSQTLTVEEGRQDSGSQQLLEVFKREGSHLTKP